MSEAPNGGNGRKRRGGKNARARSGHDFIVVGIGASAGGIGALERFFAAMPEDSGMAYVVILHLSPEHESSLAELLQRHTQMPVVQVTETVPVERNRVYVIPPAKHLQMVDGTIALAEPESQTGGRRVPIDHFFRTLGASYREHAVGVVLSGTGTDGTLGLRRIKEEGGISIAQDPQESEYDGMPRHAIADGMVDFVLPVAAIPEKLVGIRQTSETIQLLPEGDHPPEGTELKALRDILSVLRVRTGHDFSNYKQTTVLRRVTRRMQVNGVDTLRAYLEHLRGHPPEAAELQQDLLISVTNFFRDAAAFAVLEGRVIPRLFEGKEETEQVRVWVTGCATGEEAYSLAILLSEHAERLDRPPSFQVFATDIDDESITQARGGLYPDTIAADVSPERLRHFFTEDGHHYRVKKQLRERVLFAPHNILRDPPFSRLDLVSCRNLLIYLNRDTQQRVLEVFHFGLRPGGFLFLGTSESADGLPDQFSPVDKKLRIFRRGSVAPAPFNVPTAPLAARWDSGVQAPPVVSGRARTYSYPELHQTLVEQFAPPSVLVNDAHDVVHVSERAGRYLRLSGGEPTRNLVSLLHPDLRLEARAALYSAAQEGRAVATRPISVELDGAGREVRVVVRPVTRGDLHTHFLLIIFDEGEAPPRLGADADEARPDGGEAEQVVRRLEGELEQTRAILRTTVEQYETSTEEQKASNEELQAINEELRSASEELETSKEELQSLNEELQTVNHELKDKVDALGRANADLQNLFTAADVGAVFLDRELRITRFTPRLSDIYNVLPTDVGRPLVHITHNLDYAGLPADAERVLKTLANVEREVGSSSGRWYAARIMPYRTADGHVDGVVLTFMDTTEARRARDERARLAAIVDLTSDAVISFGLDIHIVTWNRGAERLFGYTAEEAVGQHVSMLLQPEQSGEHERAVELLRKGEEVNDFETVGRAKDGGPIDVSVSAAPVFDGRGQIVGGSFIVRDIAKQRAAQLLLRTSEEQLRLVLESVEDYAIFTIDLEGRITSWNSGAQNTFGFTKDEAIGQDTGVLFTPEDRAAGVDRGEMETALREGRAEDERWHVRRDGSRFYASGVMTPLEEDGRPLGFVKVARDLTERKRAEQERAELLAQLEGERASLEGRVGERTQELFSEVAERREAEGRVKELLSRIVQTQELERRRISRDLHDLLGQQLTALRLNLEAIRESCGDRDTAINDRIAQAQRIAERLDSEVDFMTWELRPAALDEIGVAAAIENFVHEWSEHYHTEAEYHSAGLGSRRLTPEVETHLYRIAQEALNNVSKHAAAGRVEVIFERRDRHVVLIVGDNGRGFDPEAMDGERGMGLLNMSERAALVGGTLEIESTPGEGTTVFARVPAQFVRGK